MEEYIIVDSGLRPGQDRVHYTVRGYRLERGQYAEIQPNADGWIYSSINHVWVGVTEACDEFIVVDAQTGEEILSDEERAEAESAARARAEERQRELEIELERLRAQLTRGGEQDG
ncbi:hypothetical protein KFU94_53890 [Chloroflexi bacterium TSY]|nr:hypothetical protein [Chloroflexi bacterium TSY]